MSTFSGLILQFALSVASITAGPIFGLFVAGMIFPWTNKYGAPIGILLSLAFMCWLVLGSLIEKPSGYKPLPTYTSSCNWTSISKSLPVTTLVPPITDSVITAEESILYNFYRTSYLWYTGFGMIVCVSVSVLVSFLTGYTKASSIDNRLMCPIFDIMFPFLPEQVLKPLRFGVIYEETNYLTEEDISLCNEEKRTSNPTSSTFKEKSESNIKASKL